VTLGNDGILGSGSGEEGKFYDCSKLYQQIGALRSELARRQSELINNELNLPLTGPFSVAGHRQQFRDKQRQLRRLLKQADMQGCTSYRDDAWDWATRPMPSPAPKGGG
jgi:hypothetical protein